MLVNTYSKCGALARAKEVLDGLPMRTVILWNALIAGYAQRDHAKEALGCFDQMQHEGLVPDASTFSCILKACGSIGALHRGVDIHSKIVRLGLLDGNLVLGGALVDMYAKCGALGKAKGVFDELLVRNTVAWNALITGYVNIEQGKEALVCFEIMQHEGFSPDSVTFICSLKACIHIRALDQGKHIHFEIVRRGLLRGDVKLGNTLVDMYAKCGAIETAKNVHEGLPIRDLVSWTALIAGYVEGQYAKEALHCFEELQHEGISTNAIMCVYILKACGSLQAFNEGIDLHAEIIKQRWLNGNVALGNALVDMYAKCGMLERAAETFEGLPSRNMASWSALIAGYTNLEKSKEALDCFEQMQHESDSPDEATLVCTLKACGNIRALSKGESIHAEILRQGFLDENVALGGALVDMYAKCGAFAKAREVFEGILVRNVVSWNTLMARYVEVEQEIKALKCFEQMQCEGLFPDAITFVCILNACSGIRALTKGEIIHLEITRQELLSGNGVLGNALVNMYAKCGALEKAEEVFERLSVRDLVSWSALIAGYLKGNHDREALNCFKQMQCEGFSPDVVALICLLKACGSIDAVDEGEDICCQIVSQGLLDGNIGLGTAVVDMYAKCGAFAKAKEVLEGLPIQDVVSWSTLIAGYADREDGKEALKCFEWMQGGGISPDATTFACVLKACSSIGALDKGENMHSELVRQGWLQQNVVLGGALVNMYAKCGALWKAEEVLEGLSIRNIVLWNALISGCAQGEHCKEMLWYFERLHCEGLFPNEITFLCVLTACSRSGLFDEGQQHFFKMSMEYAVAPGSDHHTCLVNLCGRVGYLDDAVRVIEKMLYSDVVSMWLSLLCACKRWGNAKVGRWAFNHAVQT